MGLTELHLTRFPRKPIFFTQEKIFLAFLALPDDLELLDPMKKAMAQYFKPYYNGNVIAVEDVNQLFKAAMAHDGELASNSIWKSKERPAIWFAQLVRVNI